jgi:hypothetical protein
MTRRFFAPFVPCFHPVLGRPSTPVECYLRLMFLKFRYRLGFESLCVEVRWAGVMYTRPSAECGHYRKPMRSEIRQLTARRPSATPTAVTARKTAWQAFGEG